MPPYSFLAQRATVTTTTVFVTGPTGAPISLSGPVQVPIGAIVGGLFGGIFLALAAVGGWIWWGKAIERNARKQQPALRPALKRDPYREGKRTGTPSSASAYGSRRSLPRTHPMALAAASQKSVTFAEETVDETKPSTPSPVGSTRISEDRERPKFDRTSEERTRTAVGRTSDDRERGRAGSMTPPSPVRSKLRPALPRTPSSERPYAPTRPSPLAKGAVSRSPTPSGTVSTPGGMGPAPVSRSPTPTSPAHAGSAAKAIAPPPPARLLMGQNPTSSHSSHTVQPLLLLPHVPPPPTPVRLPATPAPSLAAPALASVPPPAPLLSPALRFNSNPPPTSASTSLVPPSSFRQVSYVSTVSAPSVYSQDGTASEIEPPRMRGSAISSSEVRVSDTCSQEATNTRRG